MRDRTLSDEPMIGKWDACKILNMGREQFNQRWVDYYQYHIRHVDTTQGPKLSLVDTLKEAYPSATNQTIHYLALDYALRAREKRGGHRREAERNKNGGNES